MVVLVIVLVAATMAISDLSGFIGRYRLNAAARELAKDVEQTRVMAISESREYALVLVTADPSPADGNSEENAGRWEIRARRRASSPPDFQTVTDGIHDLHEGPGRWAGVSIEPWTSLDGPAGYSLPDALVFSPRGYLLNEFSDFEEGVVRVILRNKTAPQAERRVVRISRGGTAELAALP